MAVKDLFAAAKAVDDVDQVFSDSEIDTMDGLIEELSGELLDDVYDASSRLPNDEWLK